jgi:hypothetical protein
MSPAGWPDGSTSLDPEDYEVVNDGVALGRIYRSSSGPHVFWLWSIYGHPKGGRRNNGTLGRQRVFSG